MTLDHKTQRFSRSSFINHILFCVLQHSNSKMAVCNRCLIFNLRHFPGNNQNNSRGGNQAVENSGRMSENRNYWCRLQHQNQDVNWKARGEECLKYLSLLLCWLYRWWFICWHTCERKRAGQWPINNEITKHKERTWVSIRVGQRGIEDNIWKNKVNFCYLFWLLSTLFRNIFLF